MRVNAGRQPLLAGFLLALGLLVAGGIPAAPGWQLATARGDEPQTQPATAPTTRPANPEADQRARTIINRALDRYRSAKSYQDKLEARVEVVATDQDGQDVGQEETYSSSLLYAQPNRLALATDNFAIHCDGNQLWLYSAVLSQYVESEAPKRLDYAALSEQVGSDEPPHPVLFVLDQPDKKFSELFPMIREFTSVAREERGGRAGLRVSGLFDAAQTPLELARELIPFSLWFDEQTGLLGQIRVEFTAALRKSLALAEKELEPGEELPPGRPRRIERAMVTIELRDVRLDGDVSTARFVFKPDKEARKVAEFDWDELFQMPDPQELVGHPAPLFSGMDLDDKPLALADLRGRVVVLDFWATWCVPCVQTMPALQTLSEKFAQRPVTVLGINQDARGMDRKVRKFMADKKVTFRQYHDLGGKLGRQYKVAAIPCTFLIDAKGVVQAVHMGAVPKLLEQLSEQVEKLLKGENLFDPEKLTPQRQTEQSPPAKQ